MERQLSALVGGLLARDWTVTVIARRCDVLSHPRLRFVRVRGPRRPFSLAYPWFMAVGTWLVRGHRRGVVHTTGAIVLNRVDLSTVHYCHHAARSRADARRGTSAQLAKRLNAVIAARMKVLGERYIFERTRHLVSSSDGVAAELREELGVDDARLSMIPNGVDTAAFGRDPDVRQTGRERFRLETADFVALFLASDWERKGLEFAIRAIATVRGARLLVIGSGDEARYTALADECGSTARVLFGGPTADLAPCYAAADVFVLPTEYDSAPLALHEAAASGLPLVATRMNGSENVVLDGKTGWHVERDALDIARRLCLLRDDPELAARMGAAAREAAQRFDWNAIVERYVDLYCLLGFAPSDDSFGALAIAGG
ncbi:MAG: glycosyltransferase family 4 protein [Gaiellaceae bacterium]